METIEGAVAVARHRANRDQVMQFIYAKDDGFIVVPIDERTDRPICVIRPGHTRLEAEAIAVALDDTLNFDQL